MPSKFIRTRVAIASIAGLGLLTAGCQEILDQAGLEGEEREQLEDLMDALGDDLGEELDPGGEEVDWDKVGENPDMEDEVELRDTDGDGEPDTEFRDTDGDGKADEWRHPEPWYSRADEEWKTGERVYKDTNGDGKVDYESYDRDGDGEAEFYWEDTDHDGHIDNCFAAPGEGGCSTAG